MGRLVAGVAHEINTPVGVSLTAASLLRSQIDEVVSKYADNTLRRSDFTKFGEVAAEAAAIIVDNINRAAGLITSFKNVAVDQASAERRVFNLKDLIENTVRSLGPTLRKTRVEVAVVCDAVVQMESYPGPLSQVITNLTMNAVAHGFAPEAEGLVTIAAEIQGDKVALKFSDNGKGIAPANLARIFEPFFTTKRSEGGTGLGLHIVHNLVSQLLGGKIECASTLGQGTTFRIIMPLVHIVEPDAEVTPFGAPVAGIRIPGL